MGRKFYFLPVIFIFKVLFFRKFNVSLHLNMMVVSSTNALYYLLPILPIT